MAHLDASIINLLSPYKVTQEDELTVHFCTNLGVRYLVGFTKDVFIFDDFGYEFFIANENNTEVKDPLVFQTIQAIIFNLFENSNNEALIYICSPENEKQAIRARLFNIWFSNSDFQNDFSLTTYQSNVNGIEYFYGLILRKDNPDHNRIVEIFLDFISDY